MPVSSEVRVLERDIDRSIAAFPIWKTSRQRLLRALLDYYRDAIEVMFLNSAGALQVSRSDAFTAALFFERDLHAGMLQALKWTMELADEASDATVPPADEIMKLVDVARDYEVWVDILKTAAHDHVHIALDTERQTVTVYEGGDRTGFDRQLVSFQQRTLPLRHQVPFVAPSDQVTSKWKVRDFRQLVESLASMATEQQSETIVFRFGGKETPLFRRPAIVEVPKQKDKSLQAVVDDLTLTPSKVAGEGKWKLTTWLDVPIVMVGSLRFVASNLIQALAGPAGNDCMLRLANRADPQQYSRVSELRHGRMIKSCSSSLRGWNVRIRMKWHNPSKEVDIYATRKEKRLVLQLKSTLRPETPWEVSKRNQDLIDGVEHTAEVLKRFPAGTVGIVMTDGYRGDYQTWQVALSRGVGIGTVEDIEDIAKDPGKALNVLKSRSGFATNSRGGPVEDREFELMGWKFRLVDAPFPNKQLHG